MKKQIEQIENNLNETNIKIFEKEKEINEINNNFDDKILLKLDNLPEPFTYLQRHQFKIYNEEEIKNKDINKLTRIKIEEKFYYLEK